MKGSPEAWRVLSAYAEALGNVSEACKRMGLPRHVYYAWARQWGREEGEGNRGNTRRRHPRAVSAELREEILSLARENPEWGCDRIAYYPELKGKKISSPTVQKLLIRNGMGRRSQRME